MSAIARLTTAVIAAALLPTGAALSAAAADEPTTPTETVRVAITPVQGAPETPAEPTDSSSWDWN